MMEYIFNKSAQADLLKMYSVADACRTALQKNTYGELYPSHRTDLVIPLNVSCSEIVYVFVSYFQRASLLLVLA